MAKKPTSTLQIRADSIELDDIVLSSSGFWNKIIKIDKDQTSGTVVWSGKEIETGEVAPLFANLMDFRTVGFF